MKENKQYYKKKGNKEVFISSESDKIVIKYLENNEEYIKELPFNISTENEKIILKINDIRFTVKTEGMNCEQMINDINNCVLETFATIGDIGLDDRDILDGIKNGEYKLISIDAEKYENDMDIIAELKNSLINGKDYMITIKNIENKGFRYIRKIILITRDLVGSPDIYNAINTFYFNEATGKDKLNMFFNTEWK